jgi:hypothetical protein
VRRAPQGLDLVQRRAVADDGDDGRPGAHAQADGGGTREAEAAHGGAEEAQRRARGHARVELRAA